MTVQWLTNLTLITDFVWIAITIYCKTGNFRVQENFAKIGRFVNISCPRILPDQSRGLYHSKTHFPVENLFIFHVVKISCLTVHLKINETDLPLSQINVLGRKNAILLTFV